MRNLIKVGVFWVIISILLVSCTSIRAIQDSDDELNINDAVEQQNLERVKEMVVKGANVNKVIKNKNFFLEWSENPLKEAMFRNNEMIIRYLLDHGSDPNWVDDSGITLLMYTVGTPRGGATNSNLWRLDYAQKLIDYGVDVNQKGINGYSALDCAIFFSEDVQSQNLLLDNGAIITKTTTDVQKKVIEDTEARTINYGNAKRIFLDAKKNGIDTGLDPVLENIILGNYSKAHTLIKTNGIKEGDATNILFFTAAFGKADTMQLLMDMGLSIKTMNNNGDTLLAQAAGNGNIEMVDFLIKKGLSVNDNAAFMPPLDMAVVNNQYEMTKHLLNEGATATTSKDLWDERNTFLRAAQTGNVELLKLIDEHTKKVNENALVRAMENAVKKQENIDILSYLLKKHKNGDFSTDAKLYMPMSNVFHSACAMPRRMDMVKLFIEYGEDVNGIGEDYGEPLNSATRSGELDKVEYLIKCGADVNAVTVDSPLSVAVLSGYLDIVKLLIENDAKIYNPNEEFGISKNLVQLAKDCRSQHIYDYIVMKAKEEGGKAAEFVEDIE